MSQADGAFIRAGIPPAFLYIAPCLGGVGELIATLETFSKAHGWHTGEMARATANWRAAGARPYRGCQTGGYNGDVGRHGCKIMAKVWNLFDKQGADVV